MHNGEKSGEHLLMLGFYWLSSRDIFHEIEGQIEVAKEYDFDTISFQKGYIQEVSWSLGWIPFASDGSGNYIALDLTPGVNGKVGQIITCGCDENEMCVISESLEAFYAFIIEQFDAGRCSYEKDRSCVIWKNGHLFDELKQILLLSTDAEQENIDAWWSNLNEQWQNEIIRLLGKTPTTFAKVEAVRFFFVCDEDITDLTPISKFKNLRELCLLLQQIDDLNPILSLIDLKKLSLAQMPVKDISILSSLSSLQELGLYKTLVTNIDALPQFPVLKKVWLEGLVLESLEPLVRCKKLQELSLSNIPESAYPYLAQMKNLKNIEIYGRVKNIDFISNMKKLVSLRLEHVEADHYKVLTTLPKLKHITCTYQVFNQTHHLFEEKKHYTMLGEGTEDEKKAYHGYVIDEF